MDRSKSGRDRFVLGLLCIGAHSATISRAPFKMPDVPRPAITRPPINIPDEFATPQIKEPISKIRKNVSHVHCRRFVSGYIDSKPSPEIGVPSA